MVAQEPESTSKEARMEFIADYTLKTLRLKPDKWARMIVSDEQRNFILSFLDKGKKNLYFCFCFTSTFTLFEKLKQQLVLTQVKEI